MGVQGISKTKDRKGYKERRVLTKKVEEEQNLEMYGEVKTRYRNEAYLHGPMDNAKIPKLQLRAGDLDLPERRKRHSSGR